MIRDGNGTRRFVALLRYRGTALAELWRALRLLKALQAEAAREVGDLRSRRPCCSARTDITGEKPIEPEARANPGEIAPVPAADEPEAVAECVAASDPPGGEQATGSRECPAAPREKLLPCSGNPIEPKVAGISERNRACGTVDEPRSLVQAQRAPMPMPPIPPLPHVRSPLKWGPARPGRLSVRPIYLCARAAPPPAASGRSRARAKAKGTAPPRRRRA